MTPEQRAEVARRNGAKSRGPITPEGKMRSRRNAIKYGEHADTLKFFVPPLDACATSESRQAFYSLLDTLVETYRPVNDIGFHIVREIGIANWQIQRLTATHTVLINREYARLAGVPLPPTDPGLQTAAVSEYLFGDIHITPRLTSELDRLHRRVAELERNFVFNRARFSATNKKVVALAQEERQEEQNGPERTAAWTQQVIANNQNEAKNEKVELAA